MPSATISRMLALMVATAVLFIHRPAGAFVA